MFGSFCLSFLSLKQFSKIFEIHCWSYKGIYLWWWYFLTVVTLFERFKKVIRNCSYPFPTVHFLQWCFKILTTATFVWNWMWRVHIQLSFWVKRTNSYAHGWRGKKQDPLRKLSDYLVSKKYNKTQKLGSHLVPILQSWVFQIPQTPQFLIFNFCESVISF